MLPDALEKIGAHVFDDCPTIDIVWVENSSVVDSLKQDYNLMAVFSKRSTMVGTKLLWDLRRLKDVTIPDGTLEIGEQWFMNSGIERVTLPKGITVI